MSSPALPMPPGAWQAIEATGRWSSPVSGTIVLPRRSYSVHVTQSPDRPGEYLVHVHLYIRSRRAGRRSISLTVPGDRLESVLEKLLEPSSAPVAF
jgi:hypothetical protein